MKILANSSTTKGLCGLIGFLAAIASLTACSAITSAQYPADQSKLATQTEQVEKLKSAEYQDYMSAMSFEDSNQRLGNYYAAKASQVHRLIDQMEEGQQANHDEIGRALDYSDSAKYDDRPPVPLDDEIGNGY